MLLCCQCVLKGQEGGCRVFVMRVAMLSASATGVIRMGLCLCQDDKEINFVDDSSHNNRRGYLSRSFGFGGGLYGAKQECQAGVAATLVRRSTSSPKLYHEYAKSFMKHLIRGKELVCDLTGD